MEIQTSNHSPMESVKDALEDFQQKFSRSNIQTVIKNIASSLHIDPKLIEAIVDVESAYNPKAMRFEKDYKYLFQVPVYASQLKITSETESTMQKCSYGLMQLMGANAREHGFEGNLTDLLEPEQNLQWGGLYLKQLLHRYPDMHDAIAAYNAGSPRKQNGVYANQEYVDKVIKAYNNITT